MLELRIDRLAYDKVVVEGIHTGVMPGDHVCLLGPSGIGKTTLLNAVAGLVPRLPENAVVGRDRIRLAYLFQEHRLLPWRTVRQNIRLVGASDETIDRLLADVGLSEHAESLPDQLSLGMARRAALARCLAIEPDLLLMDEPFASLDAERATELRYLIRTLLTRRPEMAMICVTHDPADATELANRLWYLDGTPATLRWDERINGMDEVGTLMDRLRGVVLA